MDRRTFLQGSGALVAAIALPGAAATLGSPPRSMAGSGVAYDFNDVDNTIYLVDGMTITASVTNLETAFSTDNMPSLVMVPAGAPPTSASAVSLTTVGAPVIETTVGGPNRVAALTATVKRGAIPYGFVDLYFVGADRRRFSQPNRMPLIDPADLAATVPTTEVSGIKALWAAPMEAKIPREVRAASDRSTVPNGSNYCVKSPVMPEPSNNTAVFRAFPNETVFFQAVIETGAADVANVTVELDPFVDAANGVTLSTPSRTASQATTYYVAGSPVYANVYVPTYTPIRGLSTGSAGYGGITHGAYTGWNERETPLILRRPPTAYWPATGGAREQTTPFSSRPIAGKNLPYQTFTPEQLPSGNRTFSIPANSSQVVYCDVWFPRHRPGTTSALPAGTYTSAFRVKVDGVTAKTMPITVTVQKPASDPNFHLPEQPAFQYWGKFDWQGGTGYGRMYGGLSKQGVLDADDPRGAAWSATLDNVLRLHKRYKIEPHPCRYPADAGWGGTSHGPSHAAQYKGAFYSTAHGYAGPGAGQPDRYLLDWYGQWVYWSRAPDGGPYDMFRGGAEGTLTFIEDISRAARAEIRCDGHGMEVGQYFVVTGMTAGTPWEALNQRHFKVLSVIDADRFTCSADTSSYGTSYASAVGAGAAAFKDGPRPSRLWPACNRLASAMAAYPNARHAVQLADESPASDYPQLNAWIATFKDNPGVGRNVKTFLTNPLLRAYRGLATPTGTVRLEKLDILCITGGNNQDGFDEDSHDFEAQHEAALAHFRGLGTTIWRYNCGPGQMHNLEVPGAEHVVHPWSYWLEGYDNSLVWEIRGWESYQVNYNFGNPGNHNRVFSNPFTFGKEDIVSTTMGRWSSNNVHSLGDGSWLFPGRDAIFNEKAAYGLDLVMPKPPMLHASRGVEDVNIFARAAELKGREAVEAIVRKACPRTARQISNYYVYRTRRTGHTYLPWAPSMRSVVDEVRDLILS